MVERGGGEGQEQSASHFLLAQLVCLVLNEQ